MPSAPPPVVPSPLAYSRASDEKAKGESVEYATSPTTDDPHKEEDNLVVHFEEGDPDDPRVSISHLSARSLHVAHTSPVS